MTPEIGYALAVALCEDDYTGMPALDDPLWQGATDSARSAIHGDWLFCWDDETGRLQAQHASGNGAIWVEGWEPL